MQVISGKLNYQIFKVWKLLFKKILKDRMAKWSMQLCIITTINPLTRKGVCGKQCQDTNGDPAEMKSRVGWFSLVVKSTWVGNNILTNLRSKTKTWSQWNCKLEGGNIMENGYRKSKWKIRLDADEQYLFTIWQTFQPLSEVIPGTKETPYWHVSLNPSCASEVLETQG